MKPARRGTNGYRAYDESDLKLLRQIRTLQDFGFDAVIAPSFADIFYVNCTKNGLLPVILPEESCRDVAEAVCADEISVTETTNCRETIIFAT